MSPAPTPAPTPSVAHRAPALLSPNMRSLRPADLVDRDRAEVPLGRTGTPDDVAQMVTYLASDAAGFVTGQGIAVNGGHTVT